MRRLHCSTLPWLTRAAAALNTGNAFHHSSVRASKHHRVSSTPSSDTAELKRVCDAIYRSSTARERLCQSIHEPSPEIALRLLQEFSDDPGVWRRKDWAAGFRDAPDLLAKVNMALERLVQWYMVRKAPEKVAMEEPWNWFPKARLMRRNFIFHYGPTNSGKTHAALEALMKAKSGVYCAPLKALAGQVWSRVNATVPCDLLIGDERRFGGAAEHVSCTVEMTPIDLQVDVGVIDEIQMIGDRDRGWAWTRALLGLPAREIHLCGEERAIPLVENLLYKTLERGRLQLHAHKRMVPLRPSESLHGTLDNVANGDCLVCFSRQAVMKLHNELKSLDKVHSSYIYGAMPFEVREKQASAFNNGVQREVLASATCSDGGRERHVLVSTDAIAYGLNMNIERIVFTTLRKFDGKSMIDVPAPTVKQICGRAGRFGLVRQNAEGSYTTLADGVDQEKLRVAMQVAIPDLTRAGLLPTADILQLYVELTQKKQGVVLSESSAEKKTSEATEFSTVLQRFAESSKSASLFFPCDLTRSLLRIAQLLDAVPELSLKDRILFCYLPLSDGSRESTELIVAYARDHAAGKGPVALRINDRFQRLVAGRSYRNVTQQIQSGSASFSSDERHDLEAERQRCLAKLERIFKQAEMYCWLSWRFQTTFTQREEGAALKRAVAQEIESLLI